MFYSLTRTDWPGETAMKIRDAVLRELKECTSSKMGGAGSMSESEDVEMPNVGSEIPLIGGAPGINRRETSATAAPKPPPRALITGEMMGAVRLPASARRRSRQQMDFQFNLRTHRATIDEDNFGAGCPLHLEDLIPDRGDAGLPTDAFPDGEAPTEAEAQEFAGDVEMEPGQEGRECSR